MEDGFSLRNKLTMKKVDIFKKVTERIHGHKDYYNPQEQSITFWENIQLKMFMDFVKAIKKTLKLLLKHALIFLKQAITILPTWFRKQTMTKQLCRAILKRLSISSIIAIGWLVALYVISLLEYKTTKGQSFLDVVLVFIFVFGTLYLGKFLEKLLFESPKPHGKNKKFHKKIVKSVV